MRKSAEEIKKEPEGEVTTILMRPRKRKRRSYFKTKNIRPAELADVKQGIVSRATQKQDQDHIRWSAQR